jgi:hypothetical protein
MQVVGRYQLDHEAELARAVLEAAGIQAVIMSDEAGSMLPGLRILFPIRVAVADEDAEAALDVLADEVSPDPDETDEQAK